MTGTPEFGQPYLDLPTEIVKAGTEEVWEIANLTGDTHPIHFHLVNVQVLSRQAFDVDHYTGGAPTLTGPAVAPDNNELGWKETVRMNPGEVTRVWMRFNLARRAVHGPGEPAAGRAVRDPRGRVRVALPHPRPRGARHDAAARGRVTASGPSSAERPPTERCGRPLASS